MYTVTVVAEATGQTSPPGSVIAVDFSAEAVDVLWYTAVAVAVAVVWRSALCVVAVVVFESCVERRMAVSEEVAVVVARESVEDVVYDVREYVEWEVAKESSVRTGSVVVVVEDVVYDVRE